MLKVNFQLRKLLEVDRRIPKSLLAKVAQHTGLHAHQVRDMLYESKKGISFDSLGRIIDYLVSTGRIPRNQVLNRLFAITAEDFWSMIASRDTITVCAGARQDPNYANQFVEIASDAELQACVVSKANTVSRDEHSPTNSHASGAANGMDSSSPFINEQLVPSPPKDRGDKRQEEDEFEQVRMVAKEEFNAFKDRGDNQALICLGSVKSNPVIEEMLAYCFKDTAPFLSQDRLAHANLRSVPFMIRYRPNRDPQPPSCCGGTQAALDQEDAGPGIYYAAEGDKWSFVPCNDEWDGAVVFYHFEVESGRLCVMLGGFSSRATRALAHFIRTNSGKLWPPSYENHKLQVGMFVLRFHFSETSATPPTNPLKFIPPRDDDITVDRIPADAIRSRLPDHWIAVESQSQDDDASKIRGRRRAGKTDSESNARRKTRSRK